MFFNETVGGTFVEMGALDGVLISNSYAYEKVLGWSGVLIEANPNSCVWLFKNRPTASTFCTAISADSAPVTFETGDGAQVFAADNSLADASYRAKTHNASLGHRLTKVVVPSIPLGKLLRMAGTTHIDFLLS
jgi:hypothetical protein|eukprot:932082-Prymnesium_polylepis.1